MFRIALTCSIAALAVLMVPGVQPSPAQAQLRIVAESRFPVTDPTAQTELVLQFVRFPPGAWTSQHSHGGQAVNLVADGTIALHQDGRDQTYEAGQGWTDSTTQPHAAGNVGSGDAYLVTNFTLPSGTTRTTVLGSSLLEPAIVYEASFPLPLLRARTEIVQQVLELPPGWRAEHTTTGFTATMVLEGTPTYTVEGERKEYKPGQSWSAQTDAGVVEENNSHAKVRVFTTSLVPAAVPP